VARVRPEVVDKFASALKMAGAAERGRALFLARCAACHQLNEEGMRVGPDLVTAKTLGKEGLLSAILQPGERQRPGFRTHAMATRDGRTLLGIIDEQTPYTVKIRLPGERTSVWPRANITALQPLDVSLMPENLEMGLSPQDLANLLAYILAAQR
jgi:putative heme-binding domain-containing protein